MSDYEILLERAYQSYVDTWCRCRGYPRSKVNPEIGINGECYVCKAEFADCEFAEEDIVKQYLSDSDFKKYQQLMINT